MAPSEPEQPASHPVAELDDVVHQRTRLGLLVVLREVQQADFSYLKARLKLTDGNLGQHLEILARSQLVTITKGYEGKRARTWAAITKAGEAALAAEVRTLRSLLILADVDDQPAAAHG